MNESTIDKRFNKSALAHLSPDFAHVENYYSRDGKGIALDGIHHGNIKDVYEHVLLVGSTGAGKSTKVIIPSLARMEGSFVVHDPSKELLEKMRDDLLHRGYHIEVLNFSESGSGYNPLMHIKEEADLHLVSDLLVRAGRRIAASDEHWTSRASELIETMIHLEIRMSSGNPTLSQVRNKLLETINDVQKIENLFGQYADEEHRRSFVALTRNQTNELSSIFSTAANALKDFSNPAIASTTSRNDIDFGNLRKRRTALFIQNSSNRSHLYNKIISIFFEQLWLHVMEELPNPNDNDLFFIMDEAASLYLPTLPYKIDKVRKYRIGFLIAIQSLQQLESAYKENALVIEDNCKTHIYLGAQKGDTAERLERALGKEYGKSHQLPRLPREKARMLKNDITLILCNGIPPILGKNLAYYENPELKHLANSSGNENNSTDFQEETIAEPWDNIQDGEEWDEVEDILSQ